MAACSGAAALCLPAENTRTKANSSRSGRPMGREWTELDEVMPDRVLIPFKADPRYIRYM
jgi:hypothetical protein